MENKLYKIVDISKWERKVSRFPHFLPIAQDPQGNEFLVKSMSPYSRLNEMITTKACKKAGFDAVDNDFAYDKRHQQICLISRPLDYQLQLLSEHLETPFKEQTALNTNLEALFRAHPNFDENFKKRLVEEVLLRALFEDKDSHFRCNISVNASNTQPLQLSSSYDFNNCLIRDVNQQGYSHRSEVTANLEFIKRTYPQIAEEFFAKFSFDNATMDQLFNLRGAPQKWYLKCKKNDLSKSVAQAIDMLAINESDWEKLFDIADTPREWYTGEKLTKQQLQDQKKHHVKRVKGDIGKLSTQTRQQYQQNLTLMKHTYAKSDKRGCGL